MELREWLIILGLVLVAIIVVDGVRRLQRQRRTPRLDLNEDAQNASDSEEAKREETLSWELPNGGARVVRSENAPDSRLTRPRTSTHEDDDDEDYDDERELDEADAPPGRFAGLSPGKILRRPLDEMNKRRAAASEQREAQRQVERERQAEAAQRHAEELAAKEAQRAESEQLAMRSRHAESEADRYDSVYEHDRHSDEEHFDTYADYGDEPAYDEPYQHPSVALAKRHQVGAARARDTLADADEIIVITVMAHDDDGFSGLTLLKLMLACGLRYSEMGVFHRFESESDDSPLQFSMVNVVKPGTFNLDVFDEDFTTPGVTFLMPLPGAEDTHAAFEAMFETAMVIVRNLGGDLKDENRSVMTAQTVEFARQRVHEFERRWRLHRHHAN